MFRSHFGKDGKLLPVLNLVEAKFPGDIEEGHEVPDVIGRHGPTLRWVQRHVAGGHHAIEGWRHLCRVDVETDQEILDHGLERQSQPPAETRLVNGGVPLPRAGREIFGQWPQ